MKIMSYRKMFSGIFKLRKMRDEYSYAWNINEQSLL